MGYRFFLLFFCCICFFSSVVQAATLSDVNSTTVTVPDQSPTAFERAINQALIQVLIKESGNEAVGTLPAVQSILNQVKPLIKSYSYHQNTDSSSPPLELTVTFDQRAVLKVLKNANQAIWDNDRPLTLVLINTDAASPSWLSTSDQNTFTQVLYQTAQLRGLPVILPTGDLEDQSSLNKVDAATESTFQPLLQRYEAPMILIGEVKNVGEGHSRAHWILWSNTTHEEWENEGAQPTQLVSNAIHHVTNRLATQLAVLKAEGLKSDIILRIKGVQDLDTYADITSNLKKLPIISQVKLADVNTDGLVYEVSTTAGAQALGEALKTLPHLAFSSISTAPSSELVYEWKKDQAEGTP